MQRTPRAHVVIIGTEVLTAKVRDENGPALLAALREAGVRVSGLTVVPDDVPLIVEALRREAARNDHVLTTGGVGPTHDDVTFQAVAEAWGRPLRVHEGLAARFRARWPDRDERGWIRMATLPEGTELIECPYFPQARCGPFWVLPGVPELVRTRLPVLMPLLGGRPLRCYAVRTTQSEPEIAVLLERVELESGASVGSYPSWVDGQSRVRVTIEAEDGLRAEAALVLLLAGLDPASVLDVDKDYAPHR